MMMGDRMTPEEAEKWKQLFSDNKIDSVVAVAVRSEFTQIRHDIKNDVNALIQSHLKPNFFDALKANAWPFSFLILAVIIGSILLTIFLTSDFDAAQRLEILKNLAEKIAQTMAKCKP
jgi:hypothetical protein